MFIFTKKRVRGEKVRQQTHVFYLYNVYIYLIEIHVKLLSSTCCCWYILVTTINICSVFWGQGVKEKHTLGMFLKILTIIKNP